MIIAATITLIIVSLSTSKVLFGLSLCPSPLICGDNIFCSPEQCDDGNTNDNDGCSSLCIIE